MRTGRTAEKGLPGKVSHDTVSYAQGWKVLVHVQNGEAEIRCASTTRRRITHPTCITAISLNMRTAA